MLPPVTPDDRPPVVPGYEVVREIHRGGQGVVYLGVEAAAGRAVALKLLRPGGLSGAAADRLRREGRYAARLSHPNVVGLYDLLDTPAGLCLVLEYVDGPDLGRWVKDRGPLPPAAAADVVRQAALGLGHAFTHGLVHRDLKPANLVRRAADGAVKVLDLGLARAALADPADGDTLTETGAFLGSPDYVAPEQVEDPRRADVRADLYGLGCTLYYLLAGRVPFPDRSVLRKLDAHRWEEADPLEAVAPGVPEPLARVCRRLMAKDPADRYPTPAALVEELDELARPYGPAADAPRPAPAPPPAAPARFPPGYAGECRCFRGHADRVSGVAFADGERLVLSTGYDPVVRVWDVTAGRLRHELTGHAAAVWMAAAAGRSAWSAGADGTVRVWDLEAGVETGSVPLGDPGRTDFVTVDPDGRVAAEWWADGTLSVWDLTPAGPELRHRVRGVARGEETTARTAFAAAARVAVAAVAAGPERRGAVAVWDLAAGREVRRLGGHDGPVFAADVTADGRWAVSGGYDGAVRLWDVAAGREVRRFAGHRAAVRGLALTADATRLVSGGNDHTVRVWDVATGAEVARFGGHTDQVTQVAVSPGGGLAASGSADRTVRVWRLPG